MGKKREVVVSCFKKTLLSDRMRPYPSLFKSGMLEIHSIWEQFLWILHVHLIYDNKIQEENQTTLRMFFGKSRFSPGTASEISFYSFSKNKFKVLHLNHYEKICTVILHESRPLAGWTTLLHSFKIYRIKN